MERITIGKLHPLVIKIDSEVAEEWNVLANATTFQGKILSLFVEKLNRQIEKEFLSRTPNP
jgi:hypothetical protein